MATHRADDAVIVRSSVVYQQTEWSAIGWDDWKDVGAVRARLDAGADPHGGVHYFGTPLFAAAQVGSPEVVAELCRHVDDVDAEHEGRTALWEAVFHQRPGNARALVAAGADPWRPMMNGWSPGRLASAGPTPDLFPAPPGEPGLSAAETAAATEARRLIAALGEFDSDGLGLACVAGISAAEAVRRLEAVPADEEKVAELLEDPFSDFDGGLLIVGVTDVPGGCVVTQPWGYAADCPGVIRRLSAGTVCYGLFDNPKSGNQGSFARDGVIEDWDSHPGGGSTSPHESPEEILSAFLYHGHAIADRCAAAGLRLTDARAVIGPPDAWLRLPEALIR
ncbi:ankyrin repeat domain-containing protein [Nonomuraea rhodomycinica]|uniref:Ankyrin repeat domain-containing protein n=2 Tax=Nonomuraea rhodomycinica TaxID=1712872 RepID=A0A7Y6IS45_9ACTN|nr:ankyrin repeat domain-containing protein [Nonomuraea rhodomycinica]